MLNKFAARWARALDRVKLFFILLFYLVSIWIHLIHFKESFQKLIKSYDVVAVKEKKEIDMKNQSLITLKNNTSQKRNNSEQPQNHSLYIEKPS